MKKFFSNPIVIIVVVIIIVVALYYAIPAIYKYIQKIQLESKLNDVDSKLQNTSVESNPDEHLALLAERDVLKNNLSFLKNICTCPNGASHPSVPKGERCNILCAGGVI